MNIVITGATSFIALKVIERFLKDESIVIYAVVRPSSRNMYKLPKNKRVHIVELDMHHILRLGTILTNNIERSEV